MRVKGNASDGLSLVALWLTPRSAVWTDGAAAAQRRLGEGGAPSPYPLPHGETGTRGLTEEILGRVLLVVSVLWEVIDFLAHPSEGPCGDETDRVLSLGPPRRGEGAPGAPGRPRGTRLPQDADGGARRAGVGRVAEAWHCLPPRLCQILESARSAESYEADSFARRPAPPSSLPQLGRSGEKGSRPDVYGLILPSCRRGRGRRAEDSTGSGRSWHSGAARSPRGRPHLAQAPALPGPSAGGHGLLCGRPFGGRGHGAAGHHRGETGGILLPLLQPQRDSTRSWVSVA